MKKLVLLLVALACLSMSCVKADTITDARVIDANFFSAVVSLGRGTTVTPLLACSRGVFADDGCGAAPAPLTASFAVSNLLTPGGFANTKAGTPTNYMASNCGASGTAPCIPPWNIPGSADDGYHIGHYTPCDAISVSCGHRTDATCSKTAATFDGTCLLDPALAAIPGCTYTGTPSGTGVGPVLACGGGSSGFQGTIQHINFGPVNGHGCTAVQVFGHTTGGSTAMLFDDFHMFNDSGLCSTLNIWWTVEAGFNWTSGLISNGEVDGNSSVFGDSFGAASCVNLTGNAAKCNPINAFAANSGILIPIKYVAIHDMPYQSVSAGDVLLEFSWIQEWCARGPTCHGEWYLGTNTGNSPNELFDHNVILGDKFQSQGSPVPLFALSAWGPTIGNFQFTDNLQINNYAGGMTATSGNVAGCIGMPPNGGTASNPTCTPGTPTTANLFFETASSGGGLGQGVGFSEAPNECNLTSGGTNNAAPVNTYTFVPGPYAVTSPPIIAEFNLDGFTPPGGAGQYAFGTLAGGGGTLLSPSAACPLSTTATSAATGTVAVFSAAPAPIANAPVITGNYIDASSNGASPQLWEFQEATGPVNNFVSMSGNVMLAATNITVTNGEFIYSPAISACASGLFGCPQISSASNTYPLTGNAGAVVTGGAINIALTAMQGYINETPSGFTGSLANFSAVSAGGITAAAYNSSTGELDLTFSTAPFGAGIGSANNGASFTVAGLTGTGVPALNSAWPIIGTASAGTVVQLQATTGLGTLTIGTSAATTAALGVLTTTTAQTLTAGDLVYDAGAAVCSGVDPATCPAISPTRTSATVFSTSHAAANATSAALNTVRRHINTSSATINNANPAALGAGNVLLQATNSGFINVNGPVMKVAACDFTSVTTFLATCPKVTGGGTANTIFSVSPAGSAGGTNSFATVQAWQPAWCGTTASAPAQWGVSGGGTGLDNIDMTGALTALFMNQWSHTPQPGQIGC